MTPITVTSNNFTAEVLESTQLVLVDFWASWCGPCKMLAPTVDALCAERSDLKVCKINVDEQFELAVRYQINSIPTLLFFKNGKAVRRAVGLRSKAEIALITSLRRMKAANNTGTTDIPNTTGRENVVHFSISAAKNRYAMIIRIQNFDRKKYSGIKTEAAPCFLTDAARR